MRSIIGFAILWILLLPGSTPAQEPTEPSPASAYVAPSAETLAAIQGPARLAVYFDRISKSRTRTVEPGQIFEFHLVAVGAVGGLRAWEAQLILDDAIEVISREMDGMNLGRGPETYQVGLGNKCLADQQVLLVSYTARVVDEEARDLIIGIGPAPQGSSDPPAPGYLSCDPELPVLSFEWPEQAALINPDTVRLSDEAPKRFEMESGREGQK